MISAGKAIPNFAGVALVDILANGVAVLIIVIILSIAARSENEKRYVDQVKEVSAVMTREFSTSLVLNRLAASPAAVLHDYVNSEIDQFWDPTIFPILEMHATLVRDPHSGKVWHKAELLQEPNSLDDWLSEMRDTQKIAVRGDLYDVGTYYLLMSILRDHGVAINHWHFMGASAGSINVSQCPPGTSAADCTGTGAGGAVTNLEMFDWLGHDENGGSGAGETEGEGDGDGQWPHSDQGSNNGGAGRGQLADELPQGVDIGSEYGSNPTGSSSNRFNSGSYPDANANRSSGSQNGGESGGESGGSAGLSDQGSSISIRLSDPSAMQQPEGSMSMEMPDLGPEQLLRALMAYLVVIQAELDQGKSPTPLLRNFLDLMNSLIQSPPPLSPNAEAIVEELVSNIALNARFSERRGAEALNVSALDKAFAAQGALMKVLPNRLLFEIEVAAESDELLSSLPDQAKPNLNLNAYPDIWRGLQITLERNSALMSVPVDTAIKNPHWRAVAYVSPSLDDLIVGFVHTTVDDEGFLYVFGETNQVRVGGAQIVDAKELAVFGAKTWVFILYLVFGVALVALLFFWRPWSRLTR